MGICRSQETNFSGLMGQFSAGNHGEIAIKTCRAFPTFTEKVARQELGNVWKCMEMYGNVWKCMEMYGISKSL